MDYLDPQKQRAHVRRLFIGYVLMTIVVGLGTLILGFASSGYDIDKKTGSVIQNGMLFLNAAPESATISVDGVEIKDTTDARLVKPEGTYTIKLSRPGYRSWQQSITLLGGVVEHVTYPILIPENLVTKDLQVYNELPPLVSQSPDKRWLVVQVTEPASIGHFDIYDLTNQNGVPTQAALPTDLLTATDKPTALEAIEWSADNTHLLLSHAIPSGKEFILFDKDNPTASVNINRTLSYAPTALTLRDKKIDTLYSYEATGGNLRIADLKAKTVSAPIATHVIRFKTALDNLIAYVTDDNAPLGKVYFRVLENDKTYTLRELASAKDGIYGVSVSRYNGDWYYTAVSSADGKAYVYKNPLDVFKHSSTNPAPKTILTIGSYTQLLLSPNEEFIGLQSGQQFSIFDTDTDRTHHFTIPSSFDPNTTVTWMDGFHLLFQSKGLLNEVDFDGTNKQQLVTASTLPAFFDKDYFKLYTFGVPTPNGHVVFERTDLKVAPAN
jgi:hypothetical protein